METRDGYKNGDRRAGRPRGGSGSISKSDGRVQKWYGRWRSYGSTGIARTRRVVLGEVAKVSERQARKLLREVIARDSASWPTPHASRSMGLERIAAYILSKKSPDRFPSIFRRAAIAELVVASDLLADGYEVFRAVHQSACCDLVAVKGEAFLRVEVKAAKVRADGKANCDLRRNAGKFDVLAVVTPDGQIYYRRHNQLDDALRPRIL